MFKKKIPSVILSSAIFAAVVYNIWPLAYIVDSKAINNSYFSVLELPGKPYAWLFILGDILTGAAITLTALVIWGTKTFSPKILLSYLIFGLSTLLDAIVPISGHCVSSVLACGIAPSQIFTFHDICSLLAAAAIFYGLLICRRQIRRVDGPSRIYEWISYTLWFWCLAGLFLILSIVMDDLTTLSQGIYIAACGIGLVAIPLSLFKSDTSKS